MCSFDIDWVIVGKHVECGLGSVCVVSRVRVCVVIISIYGMDK